MENKHLVFRGRGKGIEEYLIKNPSAVPDIFGIDLV